MRIEIKNKKVLLSLLLNKYDPNLVRLIDDVAIALENKFQIGIIITEGWRPGPAFTLHPHAGALICDLGFIRMKNWNT